MARHDVADRSTTFFHRRWPRVAVAWLAAACAMADAEDHAPSFEREIAPILRTYCAGCHNDVEREGGLSVERYAALLAGGAEEGRAVVPGDPDDSPLIRRIASDGGDHMPPFDQPQPTVAEMATLQAWVRAGAAGPRIDASLLENLMVPALPGFAGPPPLSAAAVTAAGDRLAVARGRTVALFAMAAEQTDHGPLMLDRPVLELADPPGRVSAVHFSSEGRRLVLAGGVPGLLGIAELRDAASGDLVRSWRGHRDMLTDAELSPDGTILATTGYDRAVKLWNADDGTLLRSIDVHNGPVFDLAWHPSGEILASASGDETVKLWRVADGVRLDTLKEPQAEVLAVAFTPDGRHVVAAGRDRRIHLWRLTSLAEPGANPAVHARFAHEAAITTLGLSADGRWVVSAAEDGSVRCWSLPDLVLEQDLPPQNDVVASILPWRSRVENSGFLLAGMDGAVNAFTLSARSEHPAGPPTVVSETPETDPSAVTHGSSPGEPQVIVVAEQEPNDQPRAAQDVPVPVVIRGTVARPGDVDCYRFSARRGQPLLLEVNAARGGSRLDSRIELLDECGAALEQVVLQATRESWFTFRGKDSTQSDDFRLQNWTEMELDEYLYAAGEVVRLWHYPRGPDSGFQVYPGFGSRETFFGTTALSHALGEPAWIVEPLPPGSEPPPNGLPVFRVFHENDDDPSRRLGTDSQLVFSPPADGIYLVRVSDTRGFGDPADPESFRYELTVRPPRPAFTVSVEGKNPSVSPGGGRELVFTVERLEGFVGPVQVDVANLPEGFLFHGPLEIAAGQRQAFGVLQAGVDAATPDATATAAVTVTASAEIEGAVTRVPLGDLGTITVGEPPRVSVVIVGNDPGQADDAVQVLRIRPGETIAARVRVERRDFTGQVEFGHADAGRNLPHAVFVDNIGLNGLLIVEGENEREFFLTAAPIARPGRRLFHLRATSDGGQCSPPAILEVVPAAPDTAATADGRGITTARIEP